MRTPDNADLHQLLQRPEATDANLLDTERYELMSLSQEGRPLYKIIHATLAHAEKLGQYILSLDLSDERQAALARQLQLERNAGLNFVKWFVQQYDTPVQRQVKRNTPNG